MRAVNECTSRKQRICGHCDQLTERIDEVAHSEIVPLPGGTGPKGRGGGRGGQGRCGRAVGGSDGSDGERTPAAVDVLEHEMCAVARHMPLHLSADPRRQLPLPLLLVVGQERSAEQQAIVAGLRGQLLAHHVRDGAPLVVGREQVAPVHRLLQTRLQQARARTATQSDAVQQRVA